MSSIVSWTVAIALSPVSGIADESGVVSPGLSSIKAFDVFFCRKVQDWFPCLMTADVDDDSRDRLDHGVSKAAAAEK